MNLADWIGPGVILVFMVFVWRDLKHDGREMRADVRDLGSRIDGLSARFDRHLEGYPRTRASLAP